MSGWVAEKIFVIIYHPFEYNCFRKKNTIGTTIATIASEGMAASPSSSSAAKE